MAFGFDLDADATSTTGTCTTGLRTSSTPTTRPGVYITRTTLTQGDVGGSACTGYAAGSFCLGVSAGLGFEAVAATLM